MDLGEKRGIVCVTGASGFLASWLVKRLLEDGYFVRGTVRDPDDPLKTSHLWELPNAKENLKLFKADLLSEGAYDSIVEGCEGVFHTASAVRFTAADPQAEIVDPAVLGTLNVLKACRKSSTVKRVVYTSSSATLLFPSGVSPNAILDESVWSSEELCREKQLWYPLSKMLAEQSALEFAKSNGIELVTVAPSFTFGYVLPPVPTASAYDALMLLKGRMDNFKHFQHVGFVHLDDVASAHIRVFEDVNASGRYICSAVNLSNSEMAELFAKRYPEFNIPTNLEPLEKMYKGFSNMKLQALGIKFKGLDEMFDDFVASVKQKGLV